MDRRISKSVYDQKERRVWIAVMASGMVAFLAFSAILIGAQILHIRERREQLVLEDLPRLAGLAKD